QIAERHKCPAPAGSCRRNAAPREVAMNSVGTHPPPAAPARDENQIMITETGRERHDQVANLVTRARNGDQRAWDALVERYAPLIWSICRRYQLGRADAEDVGQYVWLNLVSQLGNLRDPAARPGWLATTPARECAKALRAARRPPAWQMPDDGSIPDTLAATAEQELLLAERHATLREALTCLPPGCQRLLILLSQDPPVPYAQISAELGIPVGSIGPTRSRCLQKLRRHPAIAALIGTELASARPEVAWQPAPDGPAQAGR